MHIKNREIYFCARLLRKSKKNFYKNLSEERITESRTFWKTVKPNLTEKTLKDERITLADRDKFLTEEKI